MKILFITTQFPYPLDNGGKIGAFNGISVVSKEYETTILSFTEETQYVNEGIEFFKQKFPNVIFEKPILHDIHIRKKTLKLCAAMIRGYFMNTPYVAAKFEDKAMYRKIDECFKTKKFDIVFIDYINMYPYAKYIRKRYQKRYRRLFFKDHNIEFEIFKQEAEKSRGLLKLILNLEWRRTKKYEINAIRESELVFTVCDENTEFIRKINPNAFSMKPTYEMLPHREKLTARNSLLYIGNLSWKPNIDGLLWFVEQVWPEIRRNIPDATLYIIGNGFKENPLPKYDGINFIGYVKDISNIYDDFKVFIVPLFEGSGIRIKILEAFNNEIAVVSTSMACETIGAETNVELIKADDKEMFSKSVLNLLKSNEQNNKLRLAGKAFLRTRYSLETRQKEFLSIIHKFHINC
jgi:glycosyltransferase involved in cell wall biosynthesis